MRVTAFFRLSFHGPDVVQSFVAISNPLAETIEEAALCPEDGTAGFQVDPIPFDRDEQSYRLAEPADILRALLLVKPQCVQHISCLIRPNVSVVTGKPAWVW